MNRLKDWLPPEPERDGPDDYWVVETRWDSIPVSREVAEALVRLLDHRPLPRWTTLRDLNGGLHRFVLAHVYRISESTVATRAAERAFGRARRLEEKADRRPWEED